MPVIATAGHVDHGKSTLIEALTGRDPDRLAEEKRRGLTIDLGFAWTTLPSGRSVAFVDVPGHRRFIGTMLAGVGPVPSALLVVAADEGWKPQSEEHLAVLDLLETERVLVALTKSDLVDDLPTRVERIRGHLLGTVAADAPIVPVSARSGTGLDDLRRALDNLIVEAEDRDRPSLWVDRVFVVAGAGTVVTGTLTGGAIGAGDDLGLWPGNRRVRARSVHSQDTEVDRVGPGNRVGINLAGLDRGQVQRGARVAKLGSLRASLRVHTTLRLARYADELGERGAHQLHVGTATTAVRLHHLDAGYGLLALAEPLCLVAGDRFVLRDTGRQLVVAGGVVLDPAPLGRRREIASRSALLAGALSQGADAVATALLETRGRAHRDDLAAWSGGGRVLTSGGLELLSAPSLELKVAAAVAAVTDHQLAHPLESGMGIGLLAQELGLDEETTRTVVVAAGQLELNGSMVSKAGETAPSVDDRWASVATALDSLSPPTLAELGLDRELLRRLLHDRKVVRVAENMVYLPGILERITEAVRAIEAPFTVSEFRQLLGITRKYAVPLLEYLDREGVTIRSGDIRTAR